MFHSFARSTQGAQITPIKPSDGLVTIIDTVPQGMTRYWIDSSEGKELPFGWQKPLILFGSTNPAATGTFAVYVKDKDGQLYSVGTATAFAPFTGLHDASILLGPGESIVARADSAGFVGPILAMAYYQDLQGPFEHKRTPITNDFQNVIPTPIRGKIHTPVGWIGVPFNMNGYLTKDGSAGGSIDSEVVYNGTKLDDIFGALAAPSAITSLAPSSVPNFSIFFGVIPLVEGMSIQAKKASLGGAVGAVCFASYLVTTDPKIHRSV